MLSLSHRCRIILIPIVISGENQRTALLQTKNCNKTDCNWGETTLTLIAGALVNFCSYSMKSDLLSRITYVDIRGVIGGKVRISLPQATNYNDVDWQYTSLSISSKGFWSHYYSYKNCVLKFPVAKYYFEIVCKQRETANLAPVHGELR